MPSRASNAVLMVDSRADRDIEISLGDIVGAGEGLCRDLRRESQDSLTCRPGEPSPLVIAGLDPAIHLLREIPSSIDGCPDQVRA
jgi:hypothetical protein